MARVRRYLWNLIIWLDQGFNTFLAGSPDETFSARTWRKAQAGQWFWRALRRVIDLAFRWESKHHCRESFENEVKGTQRPKEYRP